MSSEIAIKVENLSKCYQIYDQPSDRLKQFLFPRVQSLIGFYPKQYYLDFWALKDVTFEVKRGETVGIIGRNGSGKSTLLQLICGTLNPTNGSIQTNGRIAALLELGSGFNPEFTGKENIYLNASVLGLTQEQINNRYQEIIDFASIGEFINRPVKTYSSGMMVRLAFAVIAHVDADILVIDEALAVGDAFFTQKCMRFLRTFMKTGSILFVSHDTSSIRGFCQKTLWIDKGYILEIGDPKEVCERYLEAIFEEKQGKSLISSTKLVKKIEKKQEIKDQKLNIINQSNQRNDLKVFEFNIDAQAFGIGGAQITDVSLLGEFGQNLSWVVGGELVSILISLEIRVDIKKPIVGFYFKDRLGQTLFGDNTYLTYMNTEISMSAGEKYQAKFSFYMPIIPAGDYSISVAVADGTQEDHIQHHWIHDALIIKSESNNVATGLIGIPMLDIALSKK